MDKQALTLEQAQELIKFLFNWRMRDHGYAPTDWRRIQAQRVRAKNAVSSLFMHNPEQFLINVNKEWQSNRRLDLDLQGFTYTVGQIDNEEITNILRRIANPNSKWAS